MGFTDQVVTQCESRLSTMYQIQIYPTDFFVLGKQVLKVSSQDFSQYLLFRF